MKTPVRVGLICAMVWMAITMVFYYAGYSSQGFQVGIMINVFLLMASVAVGLYLKRKEEKFIETSFLEDFKSSMQSGAIYAVLISAFIYAYHEYVDTSVIDELRHNWVEALHESVPDEEAYKELQEKDVTWKNKSFDDYIENQEDIAYSVISSNSIFIMHLMGLFFFGIFYAFFATLILRRVVLRR